MPANGLILFAHGARDPRWAEPFESLAGRLRKAVPDQAVELMTEVEKFLKQDVGERSTFEETRTGLFQIAGAWPF